MKMDLSALRRDPIKINDKSWYYEEKKGIEIIYHEEDGKYIHITIPWFKIKRSIARAYGLGAIE